MEANANQRKKRCVGCALKEKVAELKGNERVDLVDM